MYYGTHLHMYPRTPPVRGVAYDSDHTRVLCIATGLISQASRPWHGIYGTDREYVKHQSTQLVEGYRIECLGEQICQVVTGVALRHREVSLDLALAHDQLM
jgi:hypothetical protein